MKVTGDHQPIFGPEGCQIIQVENHQPFFSSAQEQTLRHTDYHLATKGALLVPPSLTKDLQTLWAKPLSHSTQCLSKIIYPFKNCH